MPALSTSFTQNQSLTLLEVPKDRALANLEDCNPLRSEGFVAQEDLVLMSLGQTPRSSNENLPQQRLHAPVPPTCKTLPWTWEFEFWAMASHSPCILLAIKQLYFLHCNSWHLVFGSAVQGVDELSPPIQFDNTN